MCQARRRRADPRKEGTTSYREHVGAAIKYRRAYCRGGHKCIIDERVAQVQLSGVIVASVSHASYAFERIGSFPPMPVATVYSIVFIVLHWCIGIAWTWCTY